LPSLIAAEEPYEEEILAEEEEAPMIVMSPSPRAGMQLLKRSQILLL